MDLTDSTRTQLPHILLAGCSLYHSAHMQSLFGISKVDKVGVSPSVDTSSSNSKGAAVSHALEGHWDEDTAGAEPADQRIEAFRELNTLMVLGEQGVATQEVQRPVSQSMPNTATRTNDPGSAAAAGVSLLKHASLDAKAQLQYDIVHENKLYKMKSLKDEGTLAVPVHVLKLDREDEEEEDEDDEEQEAEAEGTANGDTPFNRILELAGSDGSDEGDDESDAWIQQLTELSAAESAVIDVQARAVPTAATTTTRPQPQKQQQQQSSQGSASGPGQEEILAGVNSSAAAGHSWEVTAHPLLLADLQSLSLSPNRQQLSPSLTEPGPIQVCSCLHQNR